MPARLPRVPARIVPFVALVALSALLGACGDDDSTTTTTTTTTSTTAPPGTASVHTIEVTVTDGQPDGGARTEAVELGETVRLVVTGNEADELHVHVYDLEAELVPGQPATVEFVADIPGVIEVELHDAHQLLVELEVS